MEPKHRGELRLTRRGRIVVWTLAAIAVYLIAEVDALWWSDNPIPIH